jgi:hypothetical protein
MKDELKEILMSRNLAPTISLTINLGSALKSKLKPETAETAPTAPNQRNPNELIDKLMRRLHKEPLYVKSSSSHVGGAI